MKHNEKLSQLIETVWSEAKAAKDNNELLAAARKLQNFDGPIEYKNDHLYGIATFLFLGGLALLYFFHITSTWNMMEMHEMLIGFCVVLSGIIPLVIAYNRNSDVSSLGKYIFNKDSHQDNNIKQISVRSSLMKMLPKMFPNEFDRGNYSREFISAYEAEFVGKIQKFPYTLFHFKWVNSRTVTTTSTDANGNPTVSVRTEYDRYHRYGMVLKFDRAMGISVLGYDKHNNPAEYKSASIAFNKKFSLGCRDEQALARFLEPAVVEAIEQASTVFGDLNLRIDNSGYLCISTSCDDLFFTHSAEDIENPDAFMKELEGHTELPKLRYMETFVAKIMNQLDNKF